MLQILQTFIGAQIHSQRRCVPLAHAAAALYGDHIGPLREPAIQQMQLSAAEFCRFCIAGEKYLCIQRVAGCSLPRPMQCIIYFFMVQSIAFGKCIQCMKLLPQCAVKFIAATQVFYYLQAAIQQEAMTQQHPIFCQLRVTLHKILQTALIACQHALPQANNSSEDGKLFVA